MNEDLLLRAKATCVRAGDARDDAVLLTLEAWLLRDLAGHLRRRCAQLRSTSARRRRQHEQELPPRPARPGVPTQRSRTFR